MLDLIGVYLDLAAIDQSTIEPTKVGLGGPCATYQKSAECREGSDEEASAAACAQAVASASARLRSRYRGLFRDRVPQHA
jgi:methionine synthase II (cobalamin-independent)